MSVAALRDPARHRSWCLRVSVDRPTGSPPDVVVQAWIDDRVEVVASPALIVELRLVLIRPKFRRWFDETIARQLVERIERHATALPGVDSPPSLTRDPADDYLVALAQGG